MHINQEPEEKETGQREKLTMQQEDIAYQEVLCGLRLILVKCLVEAFRLKEK